MYASLAVRGGPILTLDPSQPPRVRGLAALGEHIVALGDESDLDPLIGPGTRVLELGGRAAVPGLIDAHVHLLSFGHSLAQVDLRGASSIEAAAARVAAHRTKDEFLLGAGFDPNPWPRWPTRADLDAAVPDRPVVLQSHDHHSLWVNSAALRRAGITRDTRPPPGGEIWRDAAGEPTGILQERAAEIVWQAVGRPTPAADDAAAARAVRRANELGLVGVCTMEGRETRAALQRLRESGGLTLRVCASLAREELDGAIELGLRTGFGDDWLRIGGLKLFADGALGSQTALMLEPYAGTDQRGVAVVPAEELRELAERAAAHGIALTVHAIGDAANRVVLDALAAARAVEAATVRDLVAAGARSSPPFPRDAAHPSSPLPREEGPGEGVSRGQGTRLRHRIEHAQIVHPADLARFARTGVVASVQPTHAISDMLTAERFWGARTAHAYAWRSLQRAGAILAFGTDCPVEPLDPIPTLVAAVLRTSPAGDPRGGWHPEQRVDAETALRAHTWGAAYAAGEERRKGTLAPGKLADLTILSADPLAIPSDELTTLRVEATVVAGRVVHRTY